MKIFNIFTLLLSLFLPFTSYAIEDFPLAHFPPHCHRPASISILGDTVILEDGSEWFISSSDREKVLQWKNLDPLVIKINDGWTFYYNRVVFNKSYKYLIFNQRTSESIPVNFHMSPIISGENTNYIYDIEYHKQEIVLQDGSRWKMKNKDIFDRWSHDHLIIIGFEDGNFWSPSDYLLINATLDEFSPALRR